MTKEYKRFLTFLFAHKLKAFTVTVLALSQAFLNTLSILLIPQILFILNPNYNLAMSKSENENIIFISLEWLLSFSEDLIFLDRIISIVIMLISLFFLKNVIAYIRRILTSWLNLCVVNDIREDVFKHIQTLPLSEFRKKNSGHLLTLMTGDVAAVLASIRQVFNQMLTEPFNVIFMIFTLVMLSWKLSLVVLIIAPITTLMIAKTGSILKKKSILTMQQSDVYMTTLTESFSGIKEIKAFHAEEYQLKRYLKEQTKLKILQFKQNMFELLNMPLTEAIGSILVGAVIISGAYLIDVDKSLDAVKFATVLVGFVSIIEPMKKLGHMYNEFKVAMVSAKRLFDVIDADTNELNIGTEKKDSFEHKIEFKNVNFAYNKDSNFKLKNLNFDIRKGEMVALVGSSGSGKSTIADLLARFCMVSDGDITIDSVSIKDIKTESLRKLITIVPQESFLFNDSIENNIRFNQKSDKKAIKHASNIANADEFISNLDSGYQTMVGERGGKLSGGQRQRVAIARAVLKNSPIIILDEATSALDSQSEKLVQEALNKLLKNHSSLVIAHRLSTIINADKIIVMNEGEIVEMGTHEELVNKNGIYKKLYELQYGDKLS